MNIVFVSRLVGRSRGVCIGRRGLLSVLFLVLVVLPAAALFTGYRLGYQKAENSTWVSAAVQDELDSQRRAIDAARDTAEENLTVLALRMGQMQAQVLRLNALGQQLTQMADLDDGEFNFNAPPALGGPEGAELQQALQVPDFIALLDNLSVQLDNRSSQLSVLDSMLRNRSMQDEVQPKGRPIKSGWISSPFGIRTDPFNGRLAHHNGIDFAGKEGAEVIAVASGVVTWSGTRFGYGNLVEINHGKGYVTRYGHNKSLEVKVGDTVKKGQLIARMGSTGRSTGPHVHFEVLRNGRSVDPTRYVHAQR